MRTIRLVAVAAVALVAATSVADVIYDVDISGVESRDMQGDPSNVVMAVDIATGIGLPPGTAIEITGYGWDATLQTQPGSTLAEAEIWLEGGALILTPGAGHGGPGTEHFTTGGILPLPGGNIPLADGVLHLEFCEANDQYPNFADATWLAESMLNIQVTPEPGAAALLVVGALAAARPRRSRG